MNWKKTAIFLLKAIIIVAAYWFLIHKLTAFDNWDELIIMLKSNPKRFIKFGLPVLGLTLVNISLRALIWQNLVSVFQLISFKRAARAILLGITGGSITPAKLGDWVGKAVVLNPEFRKKGFFVAAFGHFIQNVSMIIPGIIALYFYGIYYAHLNEIAPGLNFKFLWLLESSIVLFLIALPFILKHPKLPQFKGKIQGIISIIASYKYPVYYAIISQNFIKNVFIYLQLFLLLKLFGVPITPTEALIILPTFYLSLTFVPGIMFADLGVIGAFGIMIIGSVYPNLGGVLLATMCIWTVNVGIPLLTGSILIALYKYKEKTEA